MKILEHCHASKGKEVSLDADIFQAQMMDLMASLEYVRAYIDDLLIITRGTMDNHIEKIEIVLKRNLDDRY